MRTDSFSSEKHLPVRRFIADESKVATGLYGPRAIAEDIDNIHAMFDPEADLLNGNDKGGISEKNLQDESVSLKKLKPDLQEKMSDVASGKLVEDFKEELEEKIDQKAEKAESLSGYGILDAHTKDEISALLSQKQNVTEFVSFKEEVNAKITQKTEEVVLYEDTVNTPQWTNKPTYEGVLDPACYQGDCCYVTLKDANGASLPDGQFMLKDSYADDANLYSTVFTLANLDTGFTTLTENYPVEFTSIGVNFGMRDAGVVSITYDTNDWSLFGDTGMLSVTVHGEIIPQDTNAYYYCVYKTDKNVKSYHSTNGTGAFQSDSTKDIVTYAPISETQYGDNRIYDNSTLRRDGNGYFSSERSCVVRYLTNKAKVYQVFGYGNEISKNTKVVSVIFRMNGVNKGVFRNGTIIKITEVK